MPLRRLPSGHYPIERRAGEIERLRRQAAAIAFDAAVMLDRIGVGAGWRCVDIGCGAGGILDLLAARVGSSGLSLGLDADPVLLEAARQSTRAQRAGRPLFVVSDAYRAALRPESFDLVHVRFLASTAGLVDELLRETLALVRPGGILALQEPDTDTLNCYPAHPAWDRLKAALQAGFAAAGGDTKLAQRLYPLLRRSGLQDVCYRPFVVGVTSADPMADFLPATIESIRGTLLNRGIIGAAELDRALAQCRAHLSHPDTVFTTYLTAQVWGRKAALTEGLD